MLDFTHLSPAMRENFAPFYLRAHPIQSSSFSKLILLLSSILYSSFQLHSLWSHNLSTYLKKFKSMQSFGKQNHLLSRGEFILFRINKLCILSYFAVLLSSGKDYMYHYHHLYIYSPNIHSLEYRLYIVEMLTSKLARLTSN